MFRQIRKSSLAALMIVSLCASAYPVRAEKDDMMRIAAEQQRKDPTLVLTVGKADIVDVSGPVSDIMVANPSIVDVVALQSNRLYMVGSKIGDTNVIALDAEGNIVKRMNVHVRVDETTLQETLGQLFPDQKIKAKTVNDQIIISGQVNTPGDAARVVDMATRFVGGDSKTIVNMLKVAGEQQVMMRVRIIEASRDVLKELGLESSINDGVEGTATPVFGGNPNASTWGRGAGAALGITRRTGLTQDPFGIGRIIYDTGIDGLGLGELLINALEQDNLVNILAEPNLTAISGQEAGFLAGGEFPIPVGRDRDGNITIEYKPFGVSLNFKPTVLSGDRISLQLKTEVSSLDFGQGITLQEITVPGLDVRRADTTIELNSGGSLMIAGLLQSQSIKGLAGLPGVKNTPILGDLVSSQSFARNESELLVIVTPYLVQPFADKQQAKPVPKSQSTPLSTAFASNMRKKYGKKIDFSKEDGKLGYILD